MSKLPDIIIFANDQQMINSFSNNPLVDKCNLHLSNKNDYGLNKIKLKKYNLIGLSIESNSPEEIKFFDKIVDYANDTPIVILSKFYKDNWQQIFGDKINKFIGVPFEQDQLCKLMMNVILCKVDKETDEAVPSKLDKNKLLLLFKLSREFSAIDDTTELFYSISVKATEAFNAERASVFVLNKARTELISRVAIGLDKKLIKIPVNKGVVGRVIQTGKPYITNDPKSSPYFDRAFDQKTGFVTRSIICVPLKNIENRIIGAFELINKKDGNFDKEDQFYLETMASTIAITLENTLLHHFMKRQVYEYKLLQEQLSNLKNSIMKESKSLNVIEELLSGVTSLPNKTEIFENLENLNRMLQGNDKAIQYINQIKEYITGMSSMIEKITSYEEKVLTK